MEINDIPQDNSKIFRGQRKVVYATQDGNYQTATSNGWETEEFATEQAVEELNQLTNEALDAVKRGEKSPLFYYMYRYRFDLPSLAQATGFWQWQIKRHFKPSVFEKLSDNVLAKYAEAFGVSTSTLKTI
ncbi:hypothetical protein J5A60_01020 [Aggregatibacter sp. oral taxon 513]|uniref:hypothetical protein n=1 Tax=Aggregatibacter sp. oral taxon 513 TaxID=712150 RepID=UPI001BA89ABB|nr:hypothetical protein [Aggregatibacter sp. oral taxon 513]QUC06066.1 hypothetical protein J5A60_01020 [Aggregatibacter sp. oral taxon 513]